jgi:hypothetical protein
MQYSSLAPPVDPRGIALALLTLTRIELRAWLRAPAFRRRAGAAAIVVLVLSCFDGTFAQGVLTLACTIGACLTAVRTARRDTIEAGRQTSGRISPVFSVLSGWLGALVPWAMVLMIGSVLAAVVDIPLHGFGRVGVLDLPARLLPLGAWSALAFCAFHSNRCGIRWESFGTAVACVVVRLFLGLQAAPGLELGALAAALAGAVWLETRRLNRPEGAASSQEDWPTPAIARRK